MARAGAGLLPPGKNNAWADARGPDGVGPALVCYPPAAKTSGQTYARAARTCLAGGRGGHPAPPAPPWAASRPIPARQILSPPRIIP
jgi:hypothetical protein